MTRRAWLGGAAVLAAGARAQSGRPNQARFAYVGCYTTAQRYARGDGIHVYRIDPATGGWTPVQTVGGLVNPSFLLASREERFLYSVHGDETYATAFAIDSSTGKLSTLDRVETGGRNGVHLALDPDGRFLIVANYSSGSVAVMPVKPDGGLDGPVQVVALPGQPGPHRVEQASSHPHQVLFDPSGKYVVVPDKGLDRIFVFRFDPSSGTLTPTAQGSGAARSGSGPRHGAFHPALPVLWMLNEIGCTIATYQWEAERGHLRAVQILPATPPEFTGESTPSEIAVSASGRFVYCSNRGHDSIACFAPDPATGLLTTVGWTPCGGRTPRFIGFDPSHRVLYAALEQSDTIVPFLANAAKGTLTPKGEPVHNASPVAITFVG
jgi:6-phosphogluconolactonase (cycloisomerase 2 family)